MEWIFTDSACALYGLTSVPLYNSLEQKALAFILEDTNAQTIFIETDLIMEFYKLVEKGYKSKLKNVVVMDTVMLKSNTEKTLQKLKTHHGFKIYKFEEILKAGEANPKPYKKTDPEDVHSLCYTSGTTGNPKGAILINRNFVSNVKAVITKYMQDCFNGEPFRHLSYLPLANIWERVNFLMCLYARGKFGLCGGDVRNLGESLKILKPNVMIAVPRIYNKFYATIKDSLKNAPKVQKEYIEKAIAEKIHRLRTYGEYKHKIHDAAIFNKFKSVLGGNIQC